MELCKARTKKSSPNNLNVYVIFAGHDMITDAGMAGLPIAGKNSKPHDYQRMFIKFRTFRKRGFQRENILKNSDEKKEQKQNSRPLKNTS